MSFLPNPEKRGAGILIVMIAGLFLITACEKEVIKEGNHSPVITDLSISGDSYTFGDTLTLTVVATDEDEDELTYTWSEANDLGQFAATNTAEVQWIANFAVSANAIFKVVVSDGDMSTSGSDAVTITTADNPEFYYVGSSTCKQCHESNYNDFINSGHPYKFNFVRNGVAPTYPDVVEAGRTLPLPDGATSWNDILGVIGGFGWKARYVDKTGNIVGTANSTINTGGGQNQYNFFGGKDWGWANYHASDKKEYNYGCFRCHTTGAIDDGEWLTGIKGTFVFGGVQCERCHGPGSKHVSNGGGFIDEPTGAEVNSLCGECHYRNEDHSVAVSGGYIRHHEQYDEFLYTKHYASSLTCSSCHDPHKRVVWEGDGIKAECTSCHAGKTIATPHTSLECQSCHMAKMAKSAVATVPGYQGDVHSHTFAIAADTTWNMYSDDGKTVRIGTDGLSKMSIANVCYGCHTDAAGGGGGGSVKTLLELQTYVNSGIH